MCERVCCAVLCCEDVIEGPKRGKRRVKGLQLIRKVLAVVSFA